MSMKESWVAFGSGVDRLLSLPEKVLVLLYRIRLGRVRANFSFDPLGIYSYKKIRTAIALIWDTGQSLSSPDQDRDCYLFYIFRR